MSSFLKRRYEIRMSSSRFPAGELRPYLFGRKFWTFRGAEYEVYRLNNLARLLEFDQTYHVWDNTTEQIVEVN